MEKKYIGKKTDLEIAKQKPKSEKLKKFMNALIAGVIMVTPVSLTAFEKNAYAAQEQNTQQEYYEEDEYEEEYEELPMVVEISSVSKMNLEELNKLKEDPRDKVIGIPRSITTEIDFCSYDLDTFEKILKQMQEYTKGINPNSPQIEKFMEIYQRIGANISYDLKAATKKADINDRNMYDARKLTNGLLYGKAVAPGYTDILTETLKSVGIDSREVSVKDKNGLLHYINMVNIDGKNYYTDITRDAYEIQADRDLKFCLMSQKDIEKNYTILSKNLPQCNETMNKNIIKKYKKKYNDIEKITPVKDDTRISFLNGLKVNDKNTVQIAKKDKKIETSREDDYMI